MKCSQDNLVLSAFFLLKTKEEVNMSYRLSSFEREFAAKNHNLVYAFLKYKKLDPQDYYDIVIFAYLTAVRRYFINKNLITQYDFSTIAWKAMQSAVYKENNKKKPIFVSLDEPLYRDSDVTLIDSLGHEDNFDEKIVYLDLVRKIKPHLNKKQARVLENKVNGYKYRDMAKKEGISISGIGSRLRRARMRLKLVLIEGGKRI